MPLNRSYLYIASSQIRKKSDKKAMGDIRIQYNDRYNSEKRSKSSREGERESLAIAEMG
jgi:hypothetical protein